MLATLVGEKEPLIEHHEGQSTLPWAPKPMDLSMIEEAADEEAWAAGSQAKMYHLSVPGSPLSSPLTAATTSSPLGRVSSPRSSDQGPSNKLLSPPGSTARRESRRTSARPPWELLDTTQAQALRADPLSADLSSETRAGSSGDAPRPLSGPVPNAFLSHHASSLLLRSAPTNSTQEGRSHRPPTYSKTTSFGRTQFSSALSNAISRQGSEVQDTMHYAFPVPLSQAGSSRQSSSRRSPGNQLGTLPSSSPNKSPEMSVENSSHSDVVLVPPLRLEIRSSRLSSDQVKDSAGLIHRKSRDHSPINPTPSKLAALFQGASR